MDKSYSFSDNQIFNSIVETPCCGKVISSSLIPKKNLCLINLKLAIDCASLGPDESLRLVPVLLGNNVHLELPCILINGRKRHRAYNFFSFWNNKPDNNAFYIYKEIKAKDSIVMNYQFSVPYEPWITKSNVSLYEY